MPGVLRKGARAQRPCRRKTPDDPRALLNLSIGHENLGALAFEEDDLAQARSVSKAFEIRKKVLKLTPDDLTRTRASPATG